MVAIVAGNRLGLLNTSLSTVGAAGVLGRSVLGQGSNHAFINAVNGNLILQTPDAQLAGRGTDILALRTYNSLGGGNDSDGDGWRWGYEQTVAFQGPGTPTLPGPGCTLIRTDGDGHETSYTWDAARAAFIATEGGGAYDEFGYDSGAQEWVWTDGSSRVTERFSDSTAPGIIGRLLRRTDRSNNSISLAYDAGRLSVIQDTASQQELRVTYGLFNGFTRPQRLEARALAEDAAGHATSAFGNPLRLAEYSYDGQGRLTSIIRYLTPGDSSAPAGPGFVTNYSYDDSSNRIATVTQSDGTSVSFAYDAAGRVSAVKDNGGTTDSQFAFAYAVQANSTAITDGDGRVWTYRHDGSGQLIQVQSPPVGGTPLTTNLLYDAAGNVSGITDPNNNAVTYGYAGAGNRALERDALGNTTTRTFSALNQVLTETRYRVPDPDGAGGQSPGDAATTRYVYDANARLRFSVSAEGRVTENRYGSTNAGYGLLTQTLLYVGQLYDVTALGAAQQLTEADLTSWIAGLPDRTQVQLTEFSYDLRGNVSQQNSYATVSATGNGVLDSQANVEEYVYDAYGQIRQRIAVRGSARDRRVIVGSLAYDGATRVLEATGANGQQTIVYDDANRRATMTMASGVTETREYDGRGRLASVSQTADGTMRTTRYVHDNADRLRMVEDAQGGRRYRFYDAAGRLEYTVDGTGAVTRLEHHPGGQLARQTQYRSRADAGSWYDTATNTVTKSDLTAGGVGSDVVQDAAHDRVTMFEYDAAGRLTGSTDAVGTITTTTYDGMSRVIMTQTGDRVTRYLYDKDDRRVGIVDPLGYFTEYKHDAGGRLRETVRYEQRSPAAANVSAPVWIGVTQQNLVGGRPFEYRVPAFDADGDALSFSVAGALPAWLAFDSDTATLRGTPPAAPSTESLTLRADDGRGNSSDVTLTLVVGAAVPGLAGQGAGPAWAPLSPLDIVANTPVSYVVPPASGQSLVYSVVGGLPPGLSFDANTLAITGSSSAAGFFSILLRAADANGESADRTLSVRIRTDNFAPQAPGSDQPAIWRPANGAALRSHLFYDGKGRVVGAVDDQQFLTETVCDDALGTQQTLRYLVPVTLAPGDDLASLKNRAGGWLQISSVQYDDFGRVREVSTLDGSTVTRNEYDRAGRLTRVVSAAGTGEERVRRTFYNAFGEVTGTLGGEGSAWLGINPTAQRIAEALRDYGIRYEYDMLGCRVRSVDANGNRSLFYHDRESRLTHTVNVVGQSADSTLAGEVSETTYNSFGEAESVRRYAARIGNAGMDQLLANGGGGFADPTLLGQLAALADPTLDQSTSYEYDRRGRVAKEVDGENGFTENIYNVYGELAAQVCSRRDGQSTTTQFDYDLKGHVVAQTGDAGGINASTRTDYDAFGRAIRIVNALGRATTTAYEDSGRSSVVMDPLQQSTRTEYDALGRVSRLTNPLGHQSVYTYDDTARSVTATTPEGRQITTVRNRHGETESITDPRGSVTRYAYNLDAQQTSVTDALGRTIAQTAYDKSGRAFELTDSRGTVTRLGHDQRNRVTERRVDPAGLNLTTRIEFDAIGRQSRVTEGAGSGAERVTTYVYDRKGRTVTIIVDPASGGLQLSTAYRYDGFDNTVAVTRGTVSSPDRQVTLYEFDNLGRRVKEIAAPAAVFGGGVPGTRDLTTEYRYDTTGRLIRRIDANGQSTWQVYDVAGQLTHGITALGEVSESRYDAGGRPVYTRRCLERVATGTVAGFGDRIVSFPVPATALNDAQSHVVYNADGQLRFSLHATGAAGWVINESRHDANGNVIEVRAYDRFLPDARIAMLDTAASPGISAAEVQEELVTTLGYDDQDPATLAGVPRTFMAYDANNRQRFTVDSLGTIAESVYDAAGNVVANVAFAARPALAAHTEAAIEAAVDRGDPDNRSTRYTHDAANRLRYTVDALYSVSENEYDARGNVVRKVRRATRPALTQYTENAIAAALAALPPAANDEVVHFVHDAADRLRFTIDATGSVCENAYDELGNVVVTTRFAARPAPAPATFSETAVSAAVQPLRNDIENQVTRFAYDTESRLRFVIDAKDSARESGYDAHGNVLATTRFAVRPALAQHDESTIAAAVAALQPDPRNRSTRYAYDALNRLHFTVDALGSISERVYDGLGKLAATERFAVRPPLSQYSEGAIEAAVAALRGHPANRIEHSLHDALGRLRFSLLRVSLESGQPKYRVTTHELNALGQVVSGTTYSTAVALGAIDEAAITTAIGPGKPDTDRLSRFAYDLGGREVYRLQAMAREADQGQYRVSAQRRDVFGQVVGTIDYAVPITLTAFDAASIESAVQPLADPARDRVSAVAYDALGQAVYDVRALGAGSHRVIRQEHDALGRVFRTTHYANAVGALASFDRATAEAAVNAVAGPEDRTAHYVHDAAGRQRFVLQADKSGHWTIAENRCDAFGNIVESRRYDRYVTDASIAGLEAIRPSGLGEQDVIGQLASLGYDDSTPSTLSAIQRSRFAYDTQDRLRFTVDSVGTLAENVYDALSDRTSAVRFAARPALAHYSEPAIDAAVDRNDPDNRLQHFAYDATGQLRFEVQVIEANVAPGGKHAISERRYDALGQMVESRGYATFAGHLAAYDEPTLAAAVVADPVNDRLSVVAYDAGGRQAFAARELRVGQADSYVVARQVHDALGQLIQRVDYATSSALSQFDLATVESAVAVDFWNDRATTYVRDAAGRVRFEIKPDLSFRESQYDALDQVMESRHFDFALPDSQPRTEAEMITLRGGRAVGDGVTRGQVHVYDAAGRCTSTVDAAGNTERYEYGALGDRTRWIDKNGKTWLCVHDRMGRKTTETTPAFGFKLRGEAPATPAPDRVLETRFEYDAFGNMVRKVEAANFPGDASTTDFLFDTAGRATGTLHHGYYDAVTETVESDPGPNRFRREAAIVYDPLGNTVRISDRVSAAAFTHTYRTYDPRGHVVHEVNALNNVTRYTYTSSGERETVTRYSVTISGTPQNGVYWTAREIDPQLNWGYDELGRLLPDAYARTIRLAYDKLGRKISVTLPTATYYSTHTPGDPSHANYYRPNPDFVTGVQDAAVTQFEYNAFGDVTLQRVRANTIVEWQDTSFAWDRGSRRIRNTDAAGYVTAMFYDTAGNLARLEELTGQQDGTNRTTEFVYDILDRQIRVDRYRMRYTDANGVEHGVVTWTWANGGELLDPDADVASTIRTNTYDPYGKPLTITDAAGNTTAMRYNALGQLIEVVGPANRIAPLNANGEIAVDPFHKQLTERLVTSMTLDPFGRALRQVRATSQGGDPRETLQSYDAAGNLVSTTDAESNIKRRTYDAAGRVIRETQAIHADLGRMGVNQQGLERRYFYDAMGQLTDTLDVYVDGNDLVQSGKAARYNAFGEVVEEQRKWGPASHSPAALQMARVARYDYNNAGHVFDKVAADTLTLYFYNLLGQVTREEKRGNTGNTDGTGYRITELQYDVLGRVTMVRKPAFDSDVTPGTGTTVRLLTPYVKRTLDRWGNVRGTEEGGYRFTNGQPSYAPPRLFRSYGYDDNNRVFVENMGTHGFVSTAGLSRNTQISKVMFRDLSGNAVKEVDESREPQSDELLSSRIRRKEYDKAGRVIAEIDATDIRVEYAYSIHGEKLGRRNARGTVFFDRYDRNGNVRFHGVLRTASASGPGEYNSHLGTGTISRTYLNAYLHDQANRRFASKTFTEGATAPWTYTWLDGRNFGVKHCDTFAVITQTRFDPFGNKAVEIDGAGVRSEWNAATADFVVGRIENYRLPADGGSAKFGQYTYNDYSEVKVHTYGNTRTEYERHKNGLVNRVYIMPDVTHPNVRELTRYEYDARGQLTMEGRFDSDSIQTRMISYDNQGRLARVEQSKAPGGVTCDVVYAYDEWSNIRRVQASYTQTGMEEPTSTVSWYDFDRAGRMTVSNGVPDGDGIGPKMRTRNSVRITYDNIGRRSGTTEFLHRNSKAVGGKVRKWDTLRNESYEYNELGHLLRIQQRLRATNIVETNLQNGDVERKPSRNGAWQPLSTRIANLRGDVTQSEQWTHIGIAVNDFNVDKVSKKLGVTTTVYRTDGQISWTKTDATEPKNSTETQNSYHAQTGQLESYVFRAFRSDGVPFTATFQYRHTFQNGRRVVRRISDLHNGLHTQKEYDQLGRLFAERVDLQKPNGPGSDRYEKRLYDYGADGRIIFKDAELRLSSNGPGTIQLEPPTVGQQTYVYAGNRMVGTVGTQRLEKSTKFDFAYTPMSEASGSGSSRYVVQSGDSLLDIAQACYGDGALWYVIADANGITAGPEDALPSIEVGKAYEVPDVVRSSHSATTFMPFGMGEIIGNDRPIAIPPPPPRRYSDIEVMAVAAVTITIQIGVTAALTYVGVPAPISYGIAAGLSNLGGQATSWELGMREPGQDAIDWGGVGMAAFEGYMFSVAGPVAAISREMWEQGKGGFSGWTSGPGLNWAGIGGSVFNVAFDALGPTLGGPSTESFNFSLAGLINSAYNPRSGWAIPGSGRSPVVGAFEYAYAGVASGLATMAFTWIHKQLNRPTPPGQPPGPRSVDDPRGPMPAELLDMWDDIDALQVAELDREALIARNERIAAESNERVAWELKMAAMKDRIAHFGETADDKAIIDAAKRQMNAERVRRDQEAALRRARKAERAAKLKANTLRLAAQMAAGPGPAFEAQAREAAELEAQILKGFYADGTYVNVSEGTSLMGLQLEHRTGIYDSSGAYTSKNAELDQIVGMYRTMAAGLPGKLPAVVGNELIFVEGHSPNEPMLIGNEVIIIHDLVTPAEQSRRLGFEDVMNFQEFSRVYKFQHHTTEGVERKFIEYEGGKSNRIQTNWNDIDRASGAVDLIFWTALTAPLAGFDPLLIFGPMVVGAGAERAAKWAGYDDMTASQFGMVATLGSSFVMPSVRSLGLAPSPSKINSYLAAERAARWEQNAARLEANALEWEMSHGIKIGEGVTLFKRPPAQAASARVANPVATRTAAPAAPPAGLPAGVPQLALAAARREVAGGVPAVAGVDHFPAGGTGGIASYESTASRSTRDALQIGGFEPRSGLVANMSNGTGGFTGGAIPVTPSAVRLVPMSTKMAPEWLSTAITRSGADNFVFKSIAQDAGQLAHWNQALRTVAARPNSAYALGLGRPLTSANAREVFHEVNTVFYELRGIAGAGTHNNHHWNSLALNPQLAIDPRNLFLVGSGLDAQRHRIGQHIFLHWASRQGNPWSGAVRPGAVHDLGWARSVIHALDAW